MNEEHRITLEENPNVDDVHAVGFGLNRYNIEQTNGLDFKKLVVLVRDKSNAVVGGLVGGTYWGWLYVDLLWLEDDLRGKGYGSKLLHAAEEEAIRRGCAHVYLDTFSFQARPFYEKHGYTLFGTLEDFPPGHKRYFLQKNLRAT